MNDGLWREAFYTTCGLEFSLHGGKIYKSGNRWIGQTNDFEDWFSSKEEAKRWVDWLESPESEDWKRNERRRAVVIQSAPFRGGARGTRWKHGP